jgi:predicted component of type VI protein secretion system
MAEMESQARQGEAQTLELDDFSALLSKEFKPGTEAANQVNSAVTTLAQYALQDVTKVSDDAIKSIQSIIASLDQKISEQLNQVLHHPDFQQLEGAWRGLHYLVNNTETDEMLKIKVFNISKKELGKTLKNLKALPGIKARYLKNSTKKNLAPLVVNRLVVWWGIIILITRHRMWNCWVKCPRFPLRHIRRSFLGWRHR